MIQIVIISLVLVLQTRPTGARDEYVGRRFYRTDSALVYQVPSDIPFDAIEIHLFNNRITDLKNGQFSNFSQCTILNLHLNLISIIEKGAFLGLGNLHNLFLYYNRITTLEKDTFNGLESLYELHMYYNRINEIHSGTFENLGSLKLLRLGHNKITEVSADLWIGLKSLTGLYLHVNEIATIYPGDIDHMPKLRLLYLHDNPLSTIRYNIFNSSNYAASGGHPHRLDMSFGAIQCDDNLCWLKQGERLGWITYYIHEGKIYHPQCTNYPGIAWSEIDLNCSQDVECTIFAETQCVDFCTSTRRLFRQFIPDSTCPCRCECPEQNESDCEVHCREKGQIVVPGTSDQFGCSQCKCACPPYHNNTCQTQCIQEGKIHIEGARNRYGCNICQCGCLNRDCHTECADLEFSVTTGHQGCIIGCQCICDDACEPNCYGCIKKGNVSETEKSASDQGTNNLTLPLIIVGTFIGMIALCTSLALLYCKRKGKTPFKQNSQYESNLNNAQTVMANTESMSEQYEEIDTGYLNPSGPGVPGVISPNIDGANAQQRETNIDANDYQSIKQ